MIYFLILLIFILSITIWLKIEPYCIKIKDITLKYSNLPKEFDGFSLIFLSDIHTYSWGLYEEKLKKKLNQVKESDICVICGDLAYEKEIAQNIPRLLNSAKVKGNTYIVFGNTEYKEHNDSNVLSKIYENSGYILLNNKSHKIEKNNEYINLVGIDDPVSFHDDIKKAFEGVEKDSFKIFLTHCPSMTIDAIDHNVNLVLAGHTHGGQVKLLFYTIYTHMNKNKFLNHGFWSAKKLGKKIEKKLENFNLIISNGLGTSVLKIRFLARPEIYRITLKKEK